MCALFFFCIGDLRTLAEKILKEGSRPSRAAVAASQSQGGEGGEEDFSVAEPHPSVIEGEWEGEEGEERSEHDRSEELGGAKGPPLSIASTASGVAAGIANFIIVIVSVFVGVKLKGCRDPCIIGYGNIHARFSVANYLFHSECLGTPCLSL